MTRGRGRAGSRATIALRSGEAVRPGSYSCLRCGAVQELKSAGELDTCSGCEGTCFVRRLGFLRGPQAALDHRDSA